jgi:hypothetical protein
LVTAGRRHGIPFRVDHPTPAQVAALFERVHGSRTAAYNLVHDIWGR